MRCCGFGSMVAAELSEKMDSGGPFVIAVIVAMVVSAVWFEFKPTEHRANTAQAAEMTLPEMEAVLDADEKAVNAPTHSHDAPWSEPTSAKSDASTSNKTSSVKTNQ